jgi:hypothetical protein
MIFTPPNHGVTSIDRRMAMSRLAVASVLALVAGVLGWEIFMMTSAHQTALACPKAEPGAIEVKEIELSKIYSTSAQTKLKDVRESVPDDSTGRKSLRALEDSLMANKSPPLVGIVRGDSIAEAVIASGRLVGMKKPPKSAVGPDDRSTSSQHWLFVYVGAKHSSPPHWVVGPVQVFGGRIRFSYSVDDFWPFDAVGQMVSLDFLAYLYWVPLGELKDPSKADAELVLIQKSLKATFPTKK